MSIWNSDVTVGIGISRDTYYFSLLSNRYFVYSSTDQVSSMKKLGWGKIAPATLSKWSS